MDSLDTMITTYGMVHDWDNYVRFLNNWRLIVECIQCRAMIDIACRAEDPQLRVVARAKLGDHVDLDGLDATWPGRGCFTFEGIQL